MPSILYVILWHYCIERGLRRDGEKGEGRRGVRRGERNLRGEGGKEKKGEETEMGRRDRRVKVGRGEGFIRNIHQFCCNQFYI